MSMINADCYVLAPDRKSRTAQSFLTYFFHELEPCWDPDDPSDVLGAPSGASPSQLTDFLELRPTLSYTMYLHGALHHAILCYCDDGSLILGISCGDEAASATLHQLESFAGSNGYWGGEEAPAQSKDEFLARRALGREPTAE